MTSARQCKIYKSAPRYRTVVLPHAGGGRRRQVRLIPDSSKSLLRALSEEAKADFGLLSFCRSDCDWAPPKHLFGDFICRIKADSRSVDVLSVDTMASLLHNILVSVMGLGDSADYQVKVDTDALVLRVFDVALGLEGGSHILNHLYTALAHEIENAISSFVPVEVALSHVVPGAVLFALEEERSLSCGYCSGHFSDRSGGVGTRRDDAFLRKVWSTAERMWLTQQALMRMKPLCWEAVTPLVDPRGLSNCPGATMRGLKCAIRLRAWINGDGIVEFRRRDALRAVDGSFTLGDGVEEALSILSQHGVIRECPPFGGNTPGRKPGAWWIVNPSVFERR